MKITFYVLNSQQKASSTQLEKAFLAFVCQLTQTVLNKSKQTLIILDDNRQRLLELDDQLWTFSTTEFIAHDLCLVNECAEAFPSHNQSLKDSTAPVILTDELPAHFDEVVDEVMDGVVLNLASKPLKLVSLTGSEASDDLASDTDNSIGDSDSANASSSANASTNHPQRLLEIIPADEVNKQLGRIKYQHYRAMGYPLEVHKIG